jgi:phosphate transport system substrate-binding protein
MRLKIAFLAFLMLAAGMLNGCAKPTEKAGPADSEPDKTAPSKPIVIDGSSTVFPIIEGIAEEFQRENPDVKLNVGISGTGGGMKKFVKGEIDICNASRKIKDEEVKAAQENGVEFIELNIGYDGITVAVSTENNWIDDISAEDLKRIWEPESKIKKWSDLKKGYPDKEIVLFGPDTDSGTFEFFTENICGEKGKSRSDYTASSDDNVLVEGVSKEKYSLGYFGFAYYYENKDKLKALKVNGVAPTKETIKSGEYAPLSRPLYIYVSKKSLEREEVYNFIKYLLENARDIVEEVGYVPLDEQDYEKLLQTLEESR